MSGRAFSSEERQLIEALDDLAIAERGNTMRLEVGRCWTIPARLFSEKQRQWVRGKAEKLDVLPIDSVERLLGTLLTYRRNHLEDYERVERDRTATTRRRSKRSCLVRF